ncbi:MAG: hypothetical protein ABI594_14990 [Ginsengibacter sp.]
MMNTNKKNKSLISIIIFLLITNIAMLIFFVMLNKPAQPKIENVEQGRFSTSLQKDVGFTKEQVDEYQALRKAHFEKMRPLFKTLRDTKFQFYDLMYASPVSDSLVNIAGDSIGEKQKQLDMQMFHYFESVRKVCRPEQLPKFDTAVKNLIIRLTDKPVKNGHNNH